jgi:Carboxypeptidase regulatory-like domain
MIKRTKWLSLFVGAMAAIAFSIQAQEVRATVGGRVTDAQGAAAPNVAVTVTAEDTNIDQHTRTNAEGSWSVQFLNPGRYSITIAADGFKTFRNNSFELQAADIKQIDAVLELGSARETVTVTSDVPLIDTTSATSGTVITETELQEIPSLTHIPTLLATLSPGVVAQDQNNNVGHLWSYNAASQFTANGGRNNVYSNNYLLDGFPKVKAGGDVAFIPPTDTLSEFRVQVNAYDASIGRQAGSTINMQTKSGKKNFSGMLYEYNQNSMMNANLFQTNLIGGAVTPVHFNNFGGMFGAPVWIPKVYDGRKRTFFFVSFDDTRNSNPLGTAPLSVPTALERGGDFSQSFTTQTVNGKLHRYPIQVFDPSTANAQGNRQPFQGSVIPTSQLNPIALNILKYVPLPNIASDPTGNAVNNYVPPAVRTDQFPVLSIRTDQNWSDKQRSFALINWNSLTEVAGTNFGLGNPANGNNLTRSAKSLGLDHVWILDASKVLDLSFGLTRYEEGSRDLGSGFNPTSLGFPQSLTSQLSIPSFPRIVGIAGDFGSSQANTFTNTTYYSWQANLTHSHGNHTFHYGGEYWILQQAGANVGVQPEFDFNNSDNSNNSWTRQNNQTVGGTGEGSNLAALLLGLPVRGNMPENAQSFYSPRYMVFYFQDDWRINSRLTVNAGMRWDYERPPQERYNRLTDRFDPTAINPITPSAQAAYAAILANPANASNPGVQLLQQLVPAGNFKVPGEQLFAGLNGTPRTSINGDYSQWQPRFGFAYRIGKNTVLRGGVGRFTQASYITGGQNGFSRTTSLIATQDNYITPYDTLSNPFRGGILQPTGSSLGPLTNLGAAPPSRLWLK